MEGWTMDTPKFTAFYEEIRSPEEIDRYADDIWSVMQDGLNTFTRLNNWEGETYLCTLRVANGNDCQPIP